MTFMYNTLFLAKYKQNFQKIQIECLNIFFVENCLNFLTSLNNSLMGLGKLDYRPLKRQGTKTTN